MNLKVCLNLMKYEIVFFIKFNQYSRKNSSHYKAGDKNICDKYGCHKVHLNKLS